MNSGLTLPLLILLFPLLVHGAERGGALPDTSLRGAVEVLEGKYPRESERIERGVGAVFERWRKGDGTPSDFLRFCEENFIPQGDMLQKVFSRFEENFETLFGHLHMIAREFSRPLHLSLEEPLQVDHTFAGYDPFAHVKEDFYRNRLSFALLLNFPPFSLEEILEKGKGWSRGEWARARLSDPVRQRIPAEVNLKISETFTRVGNYISEYNIFMDRVVGRGRKPLFRKGLKLISHWGLRDELKALYARKDGLKMQRVIYRIMERIIDGSIPREVINRKDYLWEPFKNSLFGEGGRRFSVREEGLRRYENLLEIFRAELLIDPHVPDAPTHILRRFEIDRQIPEKRVEELLLSILESEAARGTARLIRKRLGRELEPFDIWYTGFRPRLIYPEEELDRIVGERYPDVNAFERDIPGILVKLGFGKETALFLADHIKVDPSRGAGHAMAAEMREDRAHLRTRIPPDGMNYKGFNIAMHELGHCVEQVLTLNRMDYYSLRGVPNTAFTEAFAFLFQARDLDILGLSQGEGGRTPLDILNEFWSTFEIAGVSLLDMRVWNWLYQHRDAGPEELKAAVVEMAEEIWNTFYAPLFKVRDVPILSIYSHMIDAALYLPDYPLGHIIHFQIEEFMKGKNLAVEMERMCRSGSITPDLWMEKATGSPLTAVPLIEATLRSLEEIR